VVVLWRTQFAATKWRNEAAMTEVWGYMMDSATSRLSDAGLWRQDVAATEERKTNGMLVIVGDCGLNPQ